jgi:hypothetical protein
MTKHCLNRLFLSLLALCFFVAMPAISDDNNIPFDINEVVWYNMDRPLTDFKQTTELVNMKFDGQKLTWDNSTVANWPVTKINPSGPDVHGNMVIANIGFVIKIGGKWIGTVSEWVAQDLQWQGEWIFHDREHHGTNHTLWHNSPLKDFRATPGQVFYVCIMGCNWVGVSNVKERTNFVPITYPGAPATSHPPTNTSHDDSKEADAISYVEKLYLEMLGRKLQLDLEPGARQGFIDPLVKGLLTKAEIRALMEQNVERFVRLRFKESLGRWPTLEEQNDYALRIDRDGKTREEVGKQIASMDSSATERDSSPDTDPAPDPRSSPDSTPNANLNPDELDDSLREVQWSNNSADISGWPIDPNVKIKGISLSRDMIVFDMDDRNWPSQSLRDFFREPATKDRNDSDGNAYVFVNLNGQWHGATWEWMRPNQKAKFKSAIGHGLKDGPLKGWKPKKGDCMYFLISGHARLGARTKQIRTNLFSFTWPE